MVVLNYEKDKLSSVWKKNYEIKMKEVKAKRWEPAKKVMAKRKIKNQAVLVVPVPVSQTA